MSDPSAETGAEPGAIENADENAASSSSAESSGVKTVLDAVNTALGTTESPASGEPGKDASQQPKEGNDAEKSGDDPTDEELKLYSQNAQTRIRELVSRRKEAESQIATFQQELEQLRPQAEGMAKLNDFLTQNRITPEQMNNTMSIVALIQTGKYNEALQALGPVYQQLVQLTGNTLPQDLQREVAEGYITEQRAIELQRARMANENAQRREQAEQERRQQEEIERQAEERSTLYRSEVTAWENAKKQSDPDWSMKQELIGELAQAEMHRIGSSDPSKLPRDAKSIHAFMDRILAKVEERISPFRPKATAKTHETGRPASAGTMPGKPQSLEEAVDRALYG